MATGLGEGSVAEELGAPARPHSSLSPWSPLEGRRHWGDAGGGFPCLCTHSSHLPVGCLNSMVRGSQRLAIQCLPAFRLPGRGATSHTAGGEQAERWALIIPRPPSPQLPSKAPSL